MSAVNACLASNLSFSLSIFKWTVTSGHGGLRFGAWSRFLKATWMLSPCLRGPLGVKLSSHGHEFFGFILPPLTVLASELELVPRRGAVMAHSSCNSKDGSHEKAYQILPELRRKWRMDTWNRTHGNILSLALWKFTKWHLMHSIAASCPSFIILDTHTHTHTHSWTL